MKFVICYQLISLPWARNWWHSVLKIWVFNIVIHLPISQLFDTCNYSPSFPKKKNCWNHWVHMNILTKFKTIVRGEKNQVALPLSDPLPLQYLWCYNILYYTAFKNSKPWRIFQLHHFIALSQFNKMTLFCGQPMISLLHWLSAKNKIYHIGK